jgi:putative nucleotidyltransferase with HDIG domain
MTNRRPLLRRLKLRHVLLVVLLLSGIIPLTISSFMLIPQSQQVLRDAETDNLVRRAGALSRDVDTYLGSFRQQITQLGTGVLAPPGPPDVAERLREPWVGAYLQSFWLNQQTQGASSSLQLLRLLDSAGAGPTLARGNPTPQAVAALKTVFEQAQSRKKPAYQLVDVGADSVPLVALAVPVASTPNASDTAPDLVVEAILLLKPLEALRDDVGQSVVGVFLFQREGSKLLWWDGGGSPAVKDGLLKSETLQSFLAVPGSMTQEYVLPAEGGAQEVLAQVSAIEESGWVLIVQKPLATAFAAVDKMLFNFVISTLFLVGLALFSAFLAARWVSRPIQRLTATTHEIADGKFGRVDPQGLSFEFADLAEDFNRMSGHIESYVRRLQQAAQANRDLFIGSLRAFVAAIDAKDPYTRGHSERVAAMSRMISKYLGLPEDQQHKIWIGALLHDVGKIGVEDLVLRKAGKLSDEEFDQMKMHTVIGAEIMTAIEQLKDMIPAIRSHHEAWNGRGYPDGLKGEQIPLYARIVGVADTFDAITTNRPYQKAYSLQFAVETITRLTGSRFDAKIVTAFLRAFEAGDIRAAAESVGGRFEEEEVQEPARAAAPR